MESDAVAAAASPPRGELLFHTLLVGSYVITQWSGLVVGQCLDGALEIPFGFQFISGNSKGMVANHLLGYLL